MFLKNLAYVTQLELVSSLLVADFLGGAQK